MPRDIAPDTLPARVRQRREDHGFTQAELALEVGVTPGTIYWLERNGRTSLPTLMRVAKALRCTITDLTE